jgi:hypothetical protein
MKAAWLMFRILRLGLWLATGAYYFKFFMNREAHLTPFGHLLTSTELWLFGLPMAAVFVGFFELMIRERAGLPRPAVGRNWAASALPEQKGSSKLS